MTVAGCCGKWLGDKRLQALARRQRLASLVSPILTLPQILSWQQSSEPHYRLRTTVREQTVQPAWLGPRSKVP